MGNKKELFNRRKFLAGAGIGLLGLIGGGFYLLNKETEANRLLREFPNEISGAREVRKYKTGGAKYCLVHIKQIHYVRFIKEESMKEVREVQTDIYNIVSELVNRGLTSDIYGEGVVDEEFEKKIITDRKGSDEILLKSFEKYRNIRLGNYNEAINILELELRDESKINSKYPNINEAESYKNDLKQRIIKLKKLKDEEKELRSETEKSMNLYKSNKSALEKLVEEGKIKLFAAETYDANYKGILAKKGDSDYENKVLDDRENVLLDIIGQRDLVFNVVVYGGAHNFLDNIEKWNIKNPDKKFSLVEIFPKYYIK